MNYPFFLKNSSNQNLKLIVCFIVCYLLFPANSFSQIETDPGHRSWGKTRDGRFAICHSVSFLNKDTVAVCSPQINIDLSNYPAILDLQITRLGSSGFDLGDIDTSPTGFSASNLTGNVIDPSTTKCVQPGSGTWLSFTIYADPVVWGDNTSYNWSSTVSGINPVQGSQTDTNDDDTPFMYDSDVILGGALDVFQGANDLWYNADIEVNLDGTYDFRYRATVGNYDNDSGTGGPATNINYTDDLNHLYNIMPINSISVSNSANGRVTVNSNYNGGASLIGGSNVTPDELLISAGTLNPEEEDYVEITLNVGPIDVSQKRETPWTSGTVYGDDNAGNSLEITTTDGQDPTQGEVDGTATTCRNGLAIRFDYRADLEVIKQLTDVLPAASGSSGNFDLTYEVTVLADDDNDVNIYRLSAIDSIANAFGSSFIGVTATPIISNNTATSAPAANVSFNGVSGTGLDLLSGNTSNLIEPGQGFVITYTVEVASSGVPTDLNNSIIFTANNSLDQPITNQVANSNFLIKDSDLDGITNLEDLDDDNDGVLDTNESIDFLTNDILWSHNQSNPYGIDDTTPKINNWLLSNVENEFSGVGLTTTLNSTTLQIQNVESMSLQESIENEEYIEYAFTTSNEVEDFAILTISSSVTEEAFNGAHGDSYKAGLIISNDNFNTWQVVSANVDHSDTNDPVSNDIYYYFDGYNNPSLPLKKNTTYKFRVHFYDVVDDNAARDYIFFDDFNIQVTALQARNTDGDGLSDALDVDSDNDGCFDTVEADHIDGDNDGILGNSTVSVDSNGQVTGQGGYTGTTGNEIVATQIRIINPPSNQNETEGNATSFTIDVEADNTTDFTSGTPNYTGSGGSDSSSDIQYQWQENGINITNGGVYSGATSNTLAINDVSGLNGNNYTVVLIHNQNNCISESRSAMLTTTSPCDPIASGLPDSDGDGVTDFCDLDDDNDGILDSNECYSQVGNSLGFDAEDNYTGTPPGPGSPVTYTTAVDGVTRYKDGNLTATELNFEGWIRPGDTSVDWSEGQYVLYSNEDSHTELPAMVLQSPEGGGFGIFSTDGETIAQEIPVEIGQKYVIEVWVGIMPAYYENNKDTDGTPGIDADAGTVSNYGGKIRIGTIAGGAVAPGYSTMGDQIDPTGNPSTTVPYYEYDVLSDFPNTYTLADFPSSLPAHESSGVYTTYPTIDPHWFKHTIEFVADQTSATVQFQAISGWDAFVLDEFRIIEDPSGCDTDDDGLIDALDLDSDNDGCFDTVEAGHTDGDNDGILGNSSVSVDLNGQVTGQGGYNGVTGNEIIATQVTIISAPTNQTANDGASTSFTIDATALNAATYTSGSPDYSTGSNSSAQLLYQWQENGSNLSNGGVYSNVNTNTLNISNVNGLNGTTYTVLITHSNNNCYANSRSAMLATVDSCDPVASGKLDTDGDGISDICDEDDDNDGILDIDEGLIAPIELISNGDFSNGLTDWTVNNPSGGSAPIVGASGAVEFGYQTTGTTAVFLDPNDLANDAGVTTQNGQIGGGASGGPAQFHFNGTGDMYVAINPDEGGSDVGHFEDLNSTWSMDWGLKAHVYSFGNLSSLTPGNYDIGTSSGLVIGYDDTTNENLIIWNGVELLRRSYYSVPLSPTSMSLNITASGFVTFSATGYNPVMTVQIPGTEWQDTDNSSWQLIASQTHTPNPNNNDWIRNIEFNGSATETINNIGDSIEQNFTTTINNEAEVSYEISSQGTGSASFDVLTEILDDTGTVVMSNTSTVSSGTNTVNFNLSPTTTDTSIRVTLVSASGNLTTRQLLVDNISITQGATIDTDNDTIFDHLDLDSDNDGCFDTVEAGHADADNDGILGNSPVTVDDNGQVTGQGGYTGATGNEIVATQIRIITPPSNQNETEGNATSFTIDVEADNTTDFTSGTPNYSGTGSSDSSLNIQYQWQENGINITNGGVYSGATSNTLSISDVSGLNGNSYSIVLTHNQNNCISESRSATLTTTSPCDPIASGLPDTDGDGLTDFCDLDDDNDGIPDIHEQGIMNNCSETFLLDGSHTVDNYTTTQINTTASGISYEVSTVNGVLFDTSYDPSFSNVVAGGGPAEFRNSQTHLLMPLVTEMNVIQQATLTINFPNTVKNPTIYFTDLKNTPGSSSRALYYEIQTPGAQLQRVFGDSDFYVSGNRIGATLNNNSVNGTGLVRINGLFNQLSFTISNFSGSTTDGLNRTYINIGYYDCVSTSYTAEVDTDSDGIVNSLDLDSDNDGILDAVEAGHGQTHNAGQVNGSIGSDGIPDAVRLLPDYGAINYAIAESTDDFDFNPDFLDLDSDGDGIPDNVEAQSTIGYITPSGSFDVNGVDSSYTSGLTPENTDGTDNPDYLDLDSDNEGGDDTTEAGITLTGNDADNDGLDDATDATADYTDVGGTIDDPLTGAVILPDSDADASTGGDVDFRDATDDRPDTDDDGVPDDIDLDDDNDGILDTEEDANTDGDNDPSTNPTNSDGDSIPDYLDLDADNDGIPDVVEAQTTTGYIAPNGVVDANGVDTAFPTGIIPTNTDGVDNPDYLDLDSDNEGGDDTTEAGITLTGNDADNDGLDDVTDATADYTDVGGTIDNPLTAPVILPDLDADATTGGDVDFRDATDDRPDTDDDGVPDDIDLDDDNDGILDTEEDANTDGDNDPSTDPTNSDGDSIPDYLDLDADNDGIPDVVEAQTTTGYIAPNGVVDANGVDTAYPTGITPTNTDGTDNPDYLDLDSDNEGGNDTSEANITLTGNDTDNDGLDDATDATADYTDVGGTIDDPLTGAVILPDSDADATTGGDVDFRDATDDSAIDIDSDNDGILDVMEDLNLDGDDDPSTDPTNSDGDIYPDYLDIDSDNDGIPDNVEAQSTSEYIPPSLVDANNNGLDDAYESGLGLGLIPENTDGEDMPDYLDDDSDNDGIPDHIEANDHNHDGIPDVVLIGSDKDDDGLDDSFEGSEQIDIDVNDELDSPINDLPNTDGDNESDYRDTDDDDDGIDTIDEDTDIDGDYLNDDFDNDGIPDYLDPDQPIAYEDVEVFNVLTPNGDGAHDFLMITGLEERPDNNINIYNRWGILVYATESYSIANNYFDGTSQARATYKAGELLPTGTYFYILNYVDLDGSNKTLSGHLYLN